METTAAYLLAGVLVALATALTIRNLRARHGYSWRGVGRFYLAAPVMLALTPAAFITTLSIEATAALMSRITRSSYRGRPLFVVTRLVILHVRLARPILSAWIFVDSWVEHGRVER